MKRMNKQVVKIIKLVMMLVILTVVGIKLKGFIATIDFATLQREYNEIGKKKMAAMIAIGIGAFACMCCYDFLLLEHLGIKVGRLRCLKNAWVTNSFGNLLNFGGSIAISLRSYFYHSYMENKAVLIREVVTLSALSMSGLSFLCFVFTFILRGKGVSVKFVNGIVIGIGCIAPILIVYLIIKSIKAWNPYGYYLKLIAISIVEWIAAFALIYSIAFMLGSVVNLNQFIVLFVISSVAGIVSMVPGGLGAFDVTMIGGLGVLGMNTEKAMLILLLYRTCYYLVPFMIGALLMSRSIYQAANEKFDGVVTKIVSNVSFVILQLLIFSSGVVLLVSAALPQVVERVVFLHEIVTSHFIRTAHLFSVILGFVLVGLAMLIKYRSKKLYQITLGGLILGAVFTFSKSLDYEAALYLLFVGCILVASKRKFFKDSFENTSKNVIKQVLGLSAFLLFYVFVGYQNLSVNHYLIPNEVRYLVNSQFDDLIVVGVLGYAIGLFFIYVICSLNKEKNTK